MTIDLPAERIEWLRALPLFRSCSNHDLARIDSLVDYAELEPGDTLTIGGERRPESFIIVAGEARVVRDGVEVAVLGPGDFIGEIALLNLQPRSATVTASTHVHLLVIGPSSLGSLIRESSIAPALLQNLVIRLR